MNESSLQFETVIGRAALALWPDLPQNVQEQLFEMGVGADDNLRHRLAMYLHDHHPRTLHPPRPTALA